jgi:hypothetical protein
MILELDAFLKSPEFLNLSDQRSTLAEFLSLCQTLGVIKVEFVLYHPRAHKAPKKFPDQWFTVGVDERTLFLDFQRLQEELGARIPGINSEHPGIPVSLGVSSRVLTLKGPSNFLFLDSAHGSPEGFPGFIHSMLRDFDFFGASHFLVNSSRKIPKPISDYHALMYPPLILQDWERMMRRIIDQSPADTIDHDYLRHSLEQEKGTIRVTAGGDINRTPFVDFEGMHPDDLDFHLAYINSCPPSKLIAEVYSRVQP